MDEKNRGTNSCATTVLPEWSGPAVGLMDLDAFFASVEQLDHPDWRGRPVVVGGSAQRRGVVSTASYEARAFGVHSAMPSFQAKRLCPQAIWTSGHFERYHEMSSRVMDVIADETPLVEQVSIDEAFFDVSPGRYARESPIAICRRIQGRVARLGITCSIGLGTNKTVAKIASERQKPRGLTVVPPGTEASFLAPLPVTAMSGIGAASAARLESMGIRTLGQLARQDEETMRRAFGVHGPRMIRRAAGLEHSSVAPIDAPEDVKSVSNERTFARDLTTPEELVAAIKQVSAMVGTRLRRRGLAGSLVTLKLKFDVRHTHTAQRQLPRLTDDEHVFGSVALELLGQIWNPGTPVRLVGVAVSEFDRRPATQLSLFDEPMREEGGQAAQSATGRNLRDLSVATDAVRERFGKDALAYGRDFHLREATGA